MAKPMSEVVTERLRRMAELSKSAPARRGLDYSASAVTARLREMSDVSRLCAKLGDIGRRGRGLGAHSG